MERDKLREELKYIFENVNHWLGVAETKNAGLLAINIAIIAAVLSSNVMEQCFIFSIIIIIGVLLSTGICFIALTPILGKIKKERNEKSEDDNPLFFADIAKYDYMEYLDFVKWRYGDELFEWGNYEKDLAKEIVENSRNACLKYMLFKMGVKIEIFIIVICIVCLIIA